MSALNQLEKPASASKKVAMTREAGLYGFALASAVVGLAFWQVYHGQPLGFTDLAAGGAMLIAAVVAPYGFHVHSQAGIERHVLVAAVGREDTKTRV